MLINNDCLIALPKIASESVDFVFSDPPFNIGRAYDGYNDKRTKNEYMEFTHNWLNQCRRVLTPDGSIMVAIGDEQAALIKITLDNLGLHMRNWLIWHYTFGTNCKAKFSRTKVHILYYTKHKTNFTFNGDSIKVPSARELVYHDNRAELGGKVPDDVWVFSRVCGTFKERTPHPCQMPEALLERAILVASNPEDLILDPFAGSGTTIAVAKRLGRKFIGIEQSAKYCTIIQERLNNVRS